jgi:diaminopimelate decarboxylase
MVAAGKTPAQHADAIRAALSQYIQEPLVSVMVDRPNGSFSQQVRIVDRKKSGGRTYLITDGGLHHMLAASGNFGQLLRRNYPVAIANRFGAPPDEEVTITGCLCTPLDLLADQVMLPRAQIGDLVAIFCAGAYGLSASPQAFLGQPPAREMLV